MTYDIASMAPYKRHWLTVSSNIPRRFWGFGSEDIAEQNGVYPSEMVEWMERVMAGETIMTPGNLGKTGVGLLLDGKPGMGKTTHAVVALAEFIRQLPDAPAEAGRVLHLKEVGYNSRPVHYLTFTDFMTKKKDLFDASGDERRQLHQEIEGLHGRASDDRLNVRLLCVDDLGKEYGSKFDIDSFDDLLRARYDKGLPTIITTNVSLDAWATTYSESMGSFAHEAFVRVKLTGTDLRK